jgi:hypothetical protein
VPLQAYAWRYGGARMSSSYGRELAAGWDSAAAAASAIGRNIGESLFTLPYIVAPTAVATHWASGHPWFVQVTQCAVWLFLLVGTIDLARRSRRSDLPAWIHVAATFAVFWVWPWRFSDIRLLSLFPLILLAFGRGAATLARALLGSLFVAHWFEVLALILALANGAAMSGRAFWRSQMFGEMWANVKDEAQLDTALSVIRTRLEPDALIVSMMPEMVYLYTGRQGIMMMEDGDRLRGRLGRRDEIEAAMLQDPGRPFYLMSAPAGTTAGFDAYQATALCDDPVLAFNERYRTPDGRYWLAAITFRHAAARLPNLPPSSRGQSIVNQ